MKKNNRIILTIVIIILAISAVSYLFNKNKKVNIEAGNYSIIDVLSNRNTYPIYVASYNTCNHNQSDKKDKVQCIIVCGFGDHNPCYFFNYDLYTQKPTIIAEYYSKEDSLYQTSIKMKDNNTIQFVTIKPLPTKSPGDSHYVTYLKELDIRTGKIVIADQKENYEEYESMP